MIGQFIGAAGRAGDHRQADEIGVEIERHVRDALVDQVECPHASIRRHQRRQRGQRERLIAQRLLPDAAAMPVERALGRNQRNLDHARHSSCSIIDATKSGRGLLVCIDANLARKVAVTWPVGWTMPMREHHKRLRRLAPPTAAAADRRRLASLVGCSATYAAHSFLPRLRCGRGSRRGALDQCVRG